MLEVTSHDEWRVFTTSLKVTSQGPGVVSVYLITVTLICVQYYNCVLHGASHYIYLCPRCRQDTWMVVLYLVDDRHELRNVIMQVKYTITVSQWHKLLYSPVQVRNVDLLCVSFTALSSFTSFLSCSTCNSSHLVCKGELLVLSIVVIGRDCLPLSWFLFCVFLFVFLRFILLMLGFFISDM